MLADGHRLHDNELVDSVLVANNIVKWVWPPKILNRNFSGNSLGYSSQLRAASDEELRRRPSNLAALILASNDIDEYIRTHQRRTRGDDRKFWALQPQCFCFSVTSEDECHFDQKINVVTPHQCPLPYSNKSQISINKYSICYHRHRSKSSVSTNVSKKRCAFLMEGAYKKRTNHARFSHAQQNTLPFRYWAVLEPFTCIITLIIELLERASGTLHSFLSRANMAQCVPRNHAVDSRYVLDCSTPNVVFSQMAWTVYCYEEVIMGLKLLYTRLAGKF